MFSIVFDGVLGFLTSFVWGLWVLNMVSGSLIRLLGFTIRAKWFSIGVSRLLVGLFSRSFKVFNCIVWFFISFLGFLIRFSGLSQIQSNF